MFKSSRVPLSVSLPTCSRGGDPGAGNTVSPSTCTQFNTARNKVCIFAARSRTEGEMLPQKQNIVMAPLSPQGELTLLRGETAPSR